VTGRPTGSEVGPEDEITIYNGGESINLIKCTWNDIPAALVTCQSVQELVEHPGVGLKVSWCIDET
jgi:hypothetical protein